MLCMTTTISVSTDVKGELEAQKPNNMTWGEYLLALQEESDALKSATIGSDAHVITEGKVRSVFSEELAAQLEDALDTASMADDPGTRVGEELSETLREIREGLSTVEERTGRVERTLEDMGAHR